MRPIYPHENILDRYLLANKLLGEAMPLIKNSVREYMTKDDIEYLDNLPDIVTIYRGTSIDEAEGSVLGLGQSWTLDRTVAEFFSDTHYSQYFKDRCIMKATINKEFIFAYINVREEKECIVNFVKLENISYEIRNVVNRNKK